MKIPSKFPQFEEEEILIIASGVYAADIYLAGDGLIEKIKSIRIPRRKYSDDESYSLSKSRVGLKRSGVVISGSVREYPKEAMMQEFLNQLEKELKIISQKEKVTSVYLFSPKYVLETVKTSFPYSLKNKIQIAMSGHFIHYKPFELLEKIDKKRKKII